MCVVGCSTPFSHYAAVYQSLAQGNPGRALQEIQEAEDNYGDNSYLLYLLDQGMVLHLAGNYEESNRVLEEAHWLIEDQYSQRLRDHAAALLINETQLPYAGEPFEHVMVNVLKGLNYSLNGNFEGALVEARRIDHRLNVLTDSVPETSYHEDPFARYLTGIFFELGGDINNAYVAYRKAERVYLENQPWTRVVLPEQLQADLIRVSALLHLKEDVKKYQNRYPQANARLSRLPSSNDAQMIFLAYQGQVSIKDDRFLDIPISFEALQLVGLSHAYRGRSSRRYRGRDAVLYGLQGQIARVSLPNLITAESRGVGIPSVYFENAQFKSDFSPYPIYDVSAAAKKNFDDGYHRLVLRAVARTALKMAAVHGAGYGARAAVPNQHKGWVGPVATILGSILAITTEEADIRSWRTLPNKIYLSRVWVPEGAYAIHVGTVPSIQSNPQFRAPLPFTLKKGEVRMIVRYF